MLRIEVYDDGESGSGRGRSRVVEYWTEKQRRRGASPWKEKLEANFSRTIERCRSKKVSSSSKSAVN